jgi:glyoxylase-like metal-dependent hydrolase (beta-lactamase superfamily II)
VRTPGPERAHYALLLARPPGVLFCADLVASNPDGELRFIPFEYHEDPEATKRSTARLLEQPFAVLCLDHGTPLTVDPKAALTRLLASAG